jgi:hypothetical protein
MLLVRTLRNCFVRNGGMSSLSKAEPSKMACARLLVEAQGRNHLDLGSRGSPRDRPRHRMSAQLCCLARNSIIGKTLNSATNVQFDPGVMIMCAQP